MEWILLLGVVTGCRTMTGIAVVCWAAWLGALPEHGWAIWITYLVSALIFTGFAIGEYIGDTLPQDAQPQGRGTCSGSHRLGALVGALAATAIYEPVAGGILLGAVGAVIGTWGGYALRTATARRIGNDLPAALAESALALALAILAVWRLHLGIVFDLKPRGRLVPLQGRSANAMRGIPA